MVAHCSLNLSIDMTQKSSLTGKVRRRDGNTVTPKLNESNRRMLTKLWKEVVTSATGFDTYADMRTAWHNELQAQSSASSS
jgi:hypothetical protein